MSNKRKTDITHGVASVVVSSASSRGQQQRMAWSQCQQRLTAARQFLSAQAETKDDVIAEFEALANKSRDFRANMEEELQNADALCDKLFHKTQAAHKARRAESQATHALQLQVAQLKAARQTLMGQLQDEADAQHELKLEIARLQSEAERETEGAEQVQLEQQLQIPRLRHQLSLYAACTGIKWDYEQTNVLAGEMVSACG